LSTYKFAIWRRSKASGDATTDGITPSYTDLSGSLAAGATALFKSSGANSPAYADDTAVTNAAVDFDGNDAIAIVDASDAVIDLFGEGINNRDQNYTRKSTAPGASSAFNLADWTVSATGVADSAVSGSGDYLGYYAFTTVAQPVLELTPDVISGLNAAPGTASAAQAYTVTGSNLTAAVSVAASSSKIEFSTSSDSGFTGTLSLNPVSGAVSQTLYVRISAFAPTGTVAAAITHTSGGSSVALSVSGQVDAGSKAGLRSGLDYTLASSGFVQQASGEAVTTIDDSSGSLATVQAAIDSARSANPERFILVRLKAGANYLVADSPLTLGSKMCLSGAGTTLTASASTAAGSLMRISPGSTFVSVDRLTLVGAGKSLYGIEAAGVSRVNLDRVTVRGTGLAGIFLQGLGTSVFDNEMTVTRCTVSSVISAAGIHFKNATQCVAMDNHCYNNAVGIYLEASEHGSVVNNRFQYNSTAGVRMRDSKYTKVASNLCSGNLAGITTEGTASTSTYNFIFRNQIQASTTGIYLGQSKDTLYGNEFQSGVTIPLGFAVGANFNRVVQEGSGAAAASQEIFYPPSSTNWHTGAVKNGQSRTDVTTAANTLSAIQTVYDSARAANPGNVIVLRLTAATIIGDSPLTLQSDTCVVLEGTLNLAPGVAGFVAAGTTSVPLAYISISGGTINGQDTTGRGGLLFTNCSRVWIDHVTLRNFGTKSTRVTGSDVIQFAGCKDPCIVDSCTIDGGAARGIWTRGITGSSLSGMLFLDNTISNVNMDGIDFDVATSASAALYNLCENNIRYGIFIEEGAKFVQAIGNTCSGNDIGVNVYSFDIGPTEKNSVVGNVLSANARGLRFGAADTTPTTGILTRNNFAFNNRIFNSSRSAIDAQDDGSGNYISQNTLSGNAAEYGSTSTAVFFNSPNSAAAGVDNAAYANVDFSSGYIAGNLVGQDSWTTLGSSTNGAITVAGGEAKLLAGASYQSAFKTISPYQFADNSAVHIRLDIKVQSASVAGSDFFLVTREIDALTGQPSGKNYFRLYLKSSGAGFQLGWNPHAETGTVTPPVPTYSEAVFNYNMDYKLVLRCDSFAARNNDDTFLFVDPTNASAVPLLTRTTWTGNTADEFSAAGSTSVGARVPGCLNLVLKQQMSTSSPSLSMSVKNIVVADGLRDIGIVEVTESLPEPVVINFFNTSTSGLVTWTSGPNWSPSAPTHANTTKINFTGNLIDSLAVTNNSSENVRLNALNFANTGAGSLTLSGGILEFAVSDTINPSLTFSSISTVLQDVASDVKIHGDLQLGSNYTSANYPMISGLISGTGSVITTEAGSVSLSNNANSFMGGVWIGKGTLYASSVGNSGAASALGSGGTLRLGTASIGGALRFTNTVNETSDKMIDLSGTTGGGTITGLRSTLTLTSPLAMSGAGNKTLTLASSGSSTSGINFNGLLSNANGVLSVRINGSGNSAFSLGNPSNSFSGSVTVDGNTAGKTYTLIVDKIGSSGSSSPLGSNGIIHIGNNTSALAYNVLRYVGAGEITDKTINLSGTMGGATLVNLGTGLLKFTSDLSATGLGNKTLVLQVAADASGEFAGKIVDSSGFATSLVKNGTGIWALSGANTYTGATNIAAGTLALGVAGSIHASSGVGLSAGAILDTSAQPTFTIPAGKTYTIGLDSTAAGTSGQIKAANLDITTATVGISLINPILDDAVYVIASYSGTLTGMFGLAAPTGYSWDYGTRFNSQITLVQNAAGYAFWKVVNAGGQDPSLDWDHDGVSNGVEFFMNAPSGFTVNPALAAGVISWPNGGNIDSAAYGTQYVVQTSDDLVIWADVPASDLSSNTHDRLTYSLAGPGTRFVRLKLNPN
jgi:autotransporter-associated beta strand protein/parallel beta-helix repeat protein